MGNVDVRTIKGQKKYYIRYIDTDGKRKMKLSGQTTMAAAKTYLSEVEARIRRGIIGIPEAEAIRKQGITVREMFSKFLIEYIPDKTKDLKRYRKMCRSVYNRRIQPQLGERRAAEISSHDLKQWMQGLSTRYPANSRNEALRVLSVAYSWAISSKLITCVHPIKGAVRRASTVSSLDYYSQEEISRTLSYVRQEGSSAALDVAVGLYMVVMALFTGMRKGELLGCAGLMSILTGIRSISFGPTVVCRSQESLGTSPWMLG